jgi:hypothetical protein
MRFTQIQQPMYSPSCLVCWEINPDDIRQFWLIHADWFQVWQSPWMALDGYLGSLSGITQKEGRTPLLEEGHLTVPNFREIICHDNLLWPTFAELRDCCLQSPAVVRVPGIDARFRDSRR